jgi:hypothetical protein
MNQHNSGHGGGNPGGDAVNTVRVVLLGLVVAVLAAAVVALISAG